MDHPNPRCGHIHSGLGRPNPRFGRPNPRFGCPNLDLDVRVRDLDVQCPGFGRPNPGFECPDPGFGHSDPSFDLDFEHDLAKTLIWEGASITREAGHLRYNHILRGSSSAPPTIIQSSLDI